MEYPNVNMSSGQNYNHPPDAPRVSTGCNPPHSVTTFPSTECSPATRIYGSYSQAYQSTHEFGGPPGPPIGSPPLAYPQLYPSESHGQSLTLNQLLQQGNNSGTYQMRGVSQPHRTFDQYGYNYKPGVTPVTQDRTQVNPYSYGGPQRYPDPYSRSAYPPYPPGPGYQYYNNPPISQQPQQQRHRTSTQADYGNVNSSNSQPRPSQSTTPGCASNSSDRPSSRNINYPSTASSSPQNTQISSPVFSAGTTNQSPWSPHTVPFGSPQHLAHSQPQSQTRPRSTSRDCQFKTGNEAASDASVVARTDGANESSGAVEESGSRPQSRLSETGRPSTANSSSSTKEQNDDQIASSTSESVIQASVDISQTASSTSTPTTTSAASPISSVAHVTSPSQPYQTFGQSPVPSSSPAGVAQPPSTQGQITTSTSTGSIRPGGQPYQASPLTRSYGLSPQEPGPPRMPYPYPHPQPQSQFTNAYGGNVRPPGYYPGPYPMRPSGPMHSMIGSPNPNQSRPPYAAQTMGLPGPGSGTMPPPAAPPPAASTPNQITPSSSATDSTQPVSGPGSQYPSPGNPYPTSGAGSVQTPHSSWDQDSQPPPSSYQSTNSTSVLTQQSQQQPFNNRPCPPYAGSGERGMAFPSSPTGPNANSSPLVHNGQPGPGGIYSHSQPPSSYPSQHHHQFPYSPSQMPYHSHSQQPHPYGPGMIPGGPPNSPHPQLSQQQSNASVAPPPYPSPMLPAMSGAPVTSHLQMNREAYHSQFQHDPSQTADRHVQPGFGSTTGLPTGNQTVHSGSFSTQPTNGPSEVLKPGIGGAPPKPSNVPTGKALKTDAMVRPGTPGSIAPTSSPQTAVGPMGMVSGEAGMLNTHGPNQHRLTQPNQLQMHQYPGQCVYGPGAPSPNQYGGPQNVPFAGFQQHYRPPQAQMVQHPHNMQNSMNTPGSGSIYSGVISNPDSDTVHSSSHSISAQSLSGFHKLLEMGTEPERRPWLEHYVKFMEEIGKPLVGLPQVVKQPLDLYRFYLAVRERGGVVEVIKARRWKEISQVVNINASASAAYTLRKNYCKFLLDYECRFDQGGTDPRMLLSHIDGLSGKKKKGILSADGESGALMGSLPPPAPPSPTGSHSSASSSLLPPGSSGASLSGGPSGTAGSAASDSQPGPPSGQQQRFSDHGQPGSVSTVGESPNGIPNVPSPAIHSNPSFNTSNTIQNNAASPQRPSSRVTINGYPSIPPISTESTNRPNSTWPWSAEVSGPELSGNRQPLVSESMNGRPSTPLSRGPSAQGIRTSSAQLSTSQGPPVCVPPSVGTTMSIPKPTVTATPPPSAGPDLTVHHLSGTYPPPLPSFGPVSQHPTVSQTGVEHSFVGSQPSMHPRLGNPNAPGMTSFRAPSFNNSQTHPGMTNDSVALFRMHQLRPAVASHVPSYLPGTMPPFGPNPTPSGNAVPAHLIHHHGQRPGYVTTILKRLDHYVFPPGTVEATQVESPRRRRYRAKDIGSISPFKLLMALRSGLSAEVSWALNCLNILLRDENAFECIVPNSLPGLLTNLVELWRHTLGELFDHDLFVTSLELPTNLSCSNQPFNCKSTKFATTTVRTTCSDQSSNGISDDYGKISTDSSNLNGLVKLEREIAAIATHQGVSLSALRNGLNRLMRKSSDSKLGPNPLRLRNGLMLRFEQMSSLSANHALPPATTHTNILPDSNSSSTPVPSTRPRKRGRNLPNSVYSSISSNNNSSSPIQYPPHESSCTLSINSSNLVGNMKSEGLINWTTPQVSSISDSLRSPEACANLRDLALYVIDELRDEVKLDSVETNVSDNTKTITTRPNPPVNTAHILQCLIQKGGGDTTCHIMPPFGALPYRSRHWMNELDDCEFGYCKLPDNTSTPPPEVIQEKSSPAHDSIDETNETVEQEDDQPSCKRLRHASSSSLPCPILSPQPLDETSYDTDTKESTCPLVQDDESFADKNDAAEKESPDELEFTQLVMDANGRCPLRAREELVYHGTICLWPDSTEANSNEARAVRCLCVSTALRNLSFMGLAERYLCTQKGILALIGRVIMLGHDHVGPDDTWQTVESKTRSLEPSWCAWWTPTWLEDMRENALVLLVNIAGYLELINFDESIVRPILEGLLHWITCSTAASIDPFPGHRTLSPRRLALEALNRLCVHEANVDLLLSTCPIHESTLSRLFDRLANWLALPEDQVTRELALSTMHYLAGGGVSFSNPSTASSLGKVNTTDASSLFSLPSGYIGTTMLANAKPCPIAGLLAFIEAAEATTRRVIDQWGVQALQERPELMGTSLEMVRRAGALLDRLAADPDGRANFTPDLELRLMDLVTSRVLDATVAHLLCGALHRLLPEPQADRVIIPTASIPPMPSMATVAELLKPPAPTDNGGSCKSNVDKHNPESNAMDTKEIVSETDTPSTKCFPTKQQIDDPVVNDNDDLAHKEPAASNRANEISDQCGISCKNSDSIHVKSEPSPNSTSEVNDLSAKKEISLSCTKSVNDCLSGLPKSINSDPEPTQTNCVVPCSATL